MQNSEIQRVYQAQLSNRWNVSQSSAAERIAKLKRLKAAILRRQVELQEAIRADFSKSPVETDITEVFPVISEINHTIRHLKKWMKPKRVGSPFALTGTRSQVRCEAKGLVLVLSPWNYPFQLFANPIVTAVAAGNVVIAKPSSKVPKTSEFMKSLFAEIFAENEVAVILGSAAVSDQLLDMKFDHIFFTGSPSIGKKVMAAASKHLTPVTLELGGKSPAIVDQTADVKKAASRILWGKFINAGQTCVAPDYLLIHRSQEAAFIEEARKVVASRYGKDDAEIAQAQDFCRLVSEGHQQELKKLLDESLAAGARIAFGGRTDRSQRYLSPTLLTGVTESSPVMRGEIFGPILPVLTYDDDHQLLRIIQNQEKPLAFYLFSRNNTQIEKILRNSTAGGTCINSVVIHLANHNLPFGGVGNSGMGAYHGYFGFRALSHERAVLRQGMLDLVRFFYPPYTNFVRSFVRLVTRHLA
ncbi:MAG TPA: aldehyde dehydrogenase family protein [Bdellovibrionota bacterium]|jgi:aldehyde dehydrogenase (NAD+)|nr:aldehyde dehydrogenase family protein [Bdellovibrionota bacterium]